MKTLALEAVSDRPLSETLKVVSEGQVVVLTQGGEGRYVLGLVDDLEVEAFALSRNPEFMAYLEQCRASGDRDGGVSLEDARKILGVTD